MLKKPLRKHVCTRKNNSVMPFRQQQQYQQPPWINQRQWSMDCKLEHKRMDIQYAISRALAMFLSTGLFRSGCDWPQDDVRSYQLQALVDQMDAFLGYIHDAVNFTETELVYALILLSRVHLRGGSCVSVFTVKRFLLVCLHISIQMARDYELTFWRWPELLSNLDLPAYMLMYAEVLKILDWNTHVSSEEITATRTHVSSFIVVSGERMQHEDMWSYNPFLEHQYWYQNACYFSPTPVYNLPQMYVW